MVRTVRRHRNSRPPLAQAPQVEGSRFLFIGGLHRSGTSIIHRLLREHPDVSGFSGTGAPEDEGQHLQTVFRPAYAFGNPGVFALNPEARLCEDSALVSRENRDRLLREWGAYYDLDKQVLIEKSPPNLVRSRFLQAMFPGAAFLFVVRHPAAVALATSKWKTATLMQLLLHWHVAHSVMLADCRHLQRCAVVLYEDLVQAPNACLDQVCDLARIHRHVPQEQVVDHNPGYLEQWAQRFAAEGRLISDVLPEGQGPMAEFGYSWSAPYVIGRARRTV